MYLLRLPTLLINDTLEVSMKTDSNKYSIKANHEGLELDLRGEGLLQVKRMIALDLRSNIVILRLRRWFYMGRGIRCTVMIIT